MRVVANKTRGPRLYHGAGFAVPSVTEVVGLLQRHDFDAWKRQVGEKEANRITANARLLGTKVHAIAHEVALGKTPALEPGKRPFYEAIREFHALHVMQVLEAEKSLVSEKERVGGTFDLYARLTDGSYAVIDFKTSRGLDRQMGVQTALYALLLKEHGMPVNKRLVVRIKKEEGAEGKWYARAYNDNRGDVRAGRAAVELWHWMHKNRLLKAAS